MCTWHTANGFSCYWRYAVLVAIDTEGILATQLNLSNALRWSILGPSKSRGYFLSQAKYAFRLLSGVGVICILRSLDTMLELNANYQMGGLWLTLYYFGSLLEASYCNETLYKSCYPYCVPIDGSPSLNSFFLLYYESYGTLRALSIRDYSFHRALLLLSRHILVQIGLVILGIDDLLNFAYF